MLCFHSDSAEDFNRHCIYQTTVDQERSFWRWAENLSVFSVDGKHCRQFPPPSRTAQSRGQNSRWGGRGEERRRQWGGKRREGPRWKGWRTRESALSCSLLGSRGEVELPRQSFSDQVRAQAADVQSPPPRHSPAQLDCTLVRERGQSTKSTANTESQNWGWKWSLPCTICLSKLSSPSSSACNETPQYWSISCVWLKAFKVIP